MSGDFTFDTNDGPTLEIIGTKVLECVLSACKFTRVTFPSSKIFESVNSNNCTESPPIGDFSCHFVPSPHLGGFSASRNWYKLVYKVEIDFLGTWRLRMDYFILLTIGLQLVYTLPHNFTKLPAPNVKIGRKNRTWPRCWTKKTPQPAGAQSTLFNKEEEDYYHIVTELVSAAAAKLAWRIFISMLRRSLL